LKKLLSITIFLAFSYTVVSQSCLPEGIIFETQAQVDSFQENYPGCTEIEGFLDISESNITDLSNLIVITHVGANFVIEFNDSLTSLSGLEGITSIGGDLVIVQNPVLSNLTGLNSLTSIGGYLKISDNNSLTSLSGLDNIESGTIEDLIIFDNSLLSVCDVQSICEYLTSPTGAISIIDNAAGCNSLLELADDCNITISCLPYGNYYFLTQDDIDNFQSYYPDCTALQGDVLISGNDITNLNGLNVVTSISGSLTVSECNALTSLAGLENVNKVGNYLYIESNGSLSNLAGLENLDSVGFSLWIEDNESLINLAGLENVVYIGDGIDIAGNTALHSLTALSNVTSIGYELQIAGNQSLTSLSGLENIEGSSIHELYIVDNADLMTCEVQSICDYLAGPNGFTGIYNNSIGCNSVEEVEAACGVGFKENGTLLSHFIIYPNPSSNTITIETTELSNQSELIIFNLNGQAIDQYQITDQKTVIDISYLPAGVYFFRLTSDSLFRMFKVIKY
jgi:hypothetical protein